LFLLLRSSTSATTSAFDLGSSPSGGSAAS